MPASGVRALGLSLALALLAPLAAALPEPARAAASAAPTPGEAAMAINALRRQVAACGDLLQARNGARESARGPARELERRSEQESASESASESAGEPAFEPATAKPAPSTAAGRPLAAPALAWNARLALVAQRHARAMAEQAFFEHVDPQGRTVDQRASAAGYAWSVIGENLAAGQHDLDAALRGWIASPAHCRNLRDARFTEFGLAHVARLRADDRYGDYWVLVLARPAPGGPGAR